MSTHDMHLARFLTLSETERKAFASKASPDTIARLTSPESVAKASTAIAGTLAKADDIAKTWNGIAKATGGDPEMVARFHAISEAMAKAVRDGRKAFAVAVIAKGEVSARFGSQAKMAKALGVTPAAVTQWKTEATAKGEVAPKGDDTPTQRQNGGRKGDPLARIVKATDTIAKASKTVTVTGANVSDVRSAAKALRDAAKALDSLAKAHAA